MRKRDIVLTFVGGSIGIFLANKLCKKLPWFRKLDRDIEETGKRIDEATNEFIDKCLQDIRLDLDNHSEEPNLDDLYVELLARKIGIPEEELSEIQEKLDSLSPKTIENGA